MIVSKKNNSLTFEEIEKSINDLDASGKSKASELFAKLADFSFSTVGPFCLTVLKECLEQWPAKAFLIPLAVKCLKTKIDQWKVGSLKISKKDLESFANDYCKKLLVNLNAQNTDVYEISRKKENVISLSEEFLEIHDTMLNNADVSVLSDVKPDLLKILGTCCGVNDNLYQKFAIEKLPNLLDYIAEKKEEIKKEMEKNASLEGDLAAKQKAHNESRTEWIEARVNLENKKRYLEETQSKLQTALDGERNKVTNLQNDCDELETEVTEKENVIAQLNAEIEELRAGLANIQGARDDRFQELVQGLQKRIRPYYDDFNSANEVPMSIPLGNCVKSHLQNIFDIIYSEYNFGSKEG